ncbi:MAG TPA: aminotransferase class I/II-fold pyridoxal phosphate-dependent enzyme [bacterium]|nr:aminotransferase class I/II-fold pyridoxal phosphate-dependent enzyme [bacterium]
MADVFDKANNWTAADDVRKLGIYPYFRPNTSALGTEVTIGGKKMIMVGSNNYLGLVTHPEVLEAMVQAIRKYGSACTGSPFLNGTLDIRIELEEKLAQYVGMESALVYSTGFLANLGALSTIVTRGDYIISDRENHASIVDGQKLSYAKTIKYEHSNMEDLERVLANHKEQPKLIVTDGVFSMGGDIAELPKIVELKNKYGARLMVDEAHSLGVLGPKGDGTGPHFGVQKDVDMVMGTFSKSLVSIGGFIASTHKVIDYLRHNSRPLIFTASLSPADTAAALKSLEIIQREPERRERLWAIIKRMRAEFKAMGWNTLNTNSAIIPLMVGDNLKTFTMTKELGEMGVFATPVVSPAVPPELTLIRTSYTATHTDQQLDQVLDAFRKVGKKHGVIP